MHPIGRLRVESHIAVIRVKELPNGFRVISAEAALIDSLPNDQIQSIRDHILSVQSNQPDKVCCVAVYEVEYFDSAINDYFVKGCLLGDFSELASIQDAAASENGRQAKLIKMLNNELSE
jgi:hypothetical protein